MPRRLALSVGRVSDLTEVDAVGRILIAMQHNLADTEMRKAIPSASVHAAVALRAAQASD